MPVNEWKYLQNGEHERSLDDSACRLSESNLLLAARKGNHAAFAELCRQHSPQIFRVVSRIARNKEDAEDALQETMLRAFIHLRTFDGRSRFATWLTRIAINVTLMILRKNRTRCRVCVNLEDRFTAGLGFLEIADTSPSPELTFASQEKCALLKDARSKIRPSFQAALELRYQLESSIKETAFELGISVGAAKSRLHHAETQLRKQLAVESENNTAATGEDIQIKQISMARTFFRSSRYSNTVAK